jgi:hypothetical protein
VLGLPSTSILFGDTRVNGNIRSGGRFTLGYWIDSIRHLGIEANYLFIGRDTDRYGAASDGDPILARPFFDIETGTEVAHLVAFDPTRQGSIDITATNGFQSAELALRRALFVQQDSIVDGCDLHERRLDLLLGYRFSMLDDGLRVDEYYQTIGPTTFELLDVFDTTNTFHGAEVGISNRLRWRRLSLDLLLKLALGNSRSKVFIDGSTTTTVGGGAATTNPGGLLALTTNMETYIHSDFAVIPELGIKLGYNITQRLRATFGYTLIYWSRVARPGDQVDLDLNPSYFPNAGPPTGAARPRFALVTTDFWAQGMDFGLECRF